MVNTICFSTQLATVLVFALAEFLFTLIYKNNRNTMLPIWYIQTVFEMN